jgi:hypothetical protein
VATARKTKRPARAPSKRARPSTEAVPPAVVVVEEALAPAPDVGLSIPEPALARRALPPEPPRPVPDGRRAIFFDVENTSRAEHIARVISHLAVDRAGSRTEFFAVGNWRVIGHDTARLLARHGAALVHSAPSVGVRDWSDLRIAVTSGVWLAGARPGDVIEIVSDDRAFDAVGDVAASLGVTFRRLSYRGLLGVAAEPPAAATTHAQDADGYGDRARHRRRRGGRGRHEPVQHRAPAHAPVHQPRAVAEASGAEEPHSAPHDELVAVVRDLVEASSGRNVTLDTLANALKSRGFSRPPGSPRLITRLRRIKGLEVNRAGVITLTGAAGRPAVAEARAEPVAEPRAEPPAERIAERPAEAVEPMVEPMDKTEVVEADTVEADAVESDVDPPQPMSNRSQAPVGGGEGGGRRRRSRRGGRRRRGRDGGQGGGGQQRPGGRDGGPRDTGPRDAAPRESAPRARETDRARDVASRYTPRDVAPSWISGQPLA